MEGISQGNFTNTNYFKREESYWLSKMQGELSKSFFPYNYSAPSFYEYNGKKLNFKIDGENFNRLVNLSNNSDMRLHMILTTILIILIYKYTGDEDIIVGSPIYKQDFEGEFYNKILTLRNSVTGNMSFKELLIQVKKTIIDADENQNYPISKLLYHLGKMETQGSYPLFDIAILLENVHEKKYFENININVIFSFVRRDLHIEGILEYNSVLYTQQSVEKLVSRFFRLVQTICENINILISEITIISPQEIDLITNRFNQSQAEYFPQNKTIIELFEERAREIPDHTALVYKDIKLTYEDLYERINKLATMLREKGVKRGDIVGILIDRSPEMVIGIMGILKAGGAYMPIDTNYPFNRIEYMLKDSKTSILVSQSYFSETITFPIQIINLDTNDLNNSKCIVQDNISKPSDIAYIIYTSGSTGEPKGVIIEHASIVNVLYGLQQLYPLDEGDSFLFKTSYTFDVSVAELFGWFIGKGKLVILEKGEERSPNSILQAVNKHGITHINFVPSMFAKFISSISTGNVSILNKLKYIFVAGEALSDSIARHFNKLTNRVILENLYGPTEATIYATHYRVRNIVEGMNVPIGKPLQNVKAYIVDKHRKLQPPGIAGELCISGCGLARGYLNKPELTEEKFTVNPFSKDELLYKTGDLAKWMDDGNIEFLGRIDNQVKVRGFRIEVEEIESHLLNHENIKDAVATVKDLQDEKYLCAYYVSDKSLSVNCLREYMSTKLPEYMIPDYFIPLKKIPLTSSGKIDRKSLPEPGEIYNIGEEYLEPSDKYEEELLSIWKDILNIESIGVNHSFFSLGGNSIRLIILHERIDKLYPGIISVTDIFSFPTIRKLAEYIREKSSKSEDIKIFALNLPSEYLVSNNEYREDNFEFYYSINGPFHERINSVCHNREIRKRDIFLSAYIYVFYEISGEQTIEVQTLIKDDFAIPLKIDFTEINDIHDLIQKVSSGHYLMKNYPEYNIHNVNKIASHKDFFSVIPLFFESGLVSDDTELSDFFDIIMEFGEKPGKDGFRIYYNKKLRKEKVKELFNSYIQIVKALAEELDNS
jgi:fengycin family lipopeptide synthetase D